MPQQAPMTWTGILPLLLELAARALRLPAGAIDPAAPLAASGLDSLAAVELCDGVEAATGVRVEMERLLAGASLLEVAAEVAAAGGAVAAAPQGVPRELDLPLSAGQRALWFLDRLAPGGSAYVLAGAFRVEERLDDGALRRALQALARRHPALTATFHEAGGNPVQRLGEGAGIEFRVEEVAVRSGADGAPDLAERLREEARRPFDLSQGPLLRATVFRPAEGAAVVLLAVHHIVADFASLAVLARELEPFYREAAGGPPADLAPLRASYLDQIARQTAVLSAAGERLWDFWREELAGAPLVLELPSDRPRLAVLPELGQADGCSVAAAWESPAGAALAGLARGSGATLYMALLALFEVLLARTSGQEDLLLGSPVAGRVGADLARVVGYFVNPLVVRSDIAGDPAFTELLVRVRRRVLRIFAHSELPFSVLAERLAPAGRAAGRSPVFQVMLTMQGGPAAGTAPGGDGLAALAVGRSGVPVAFLPDLAAETLALPPAAPLFDLVLDIAPLGGGTLAGRFTGDAALFDAATVARLAGHFGALLDGAVAQPAARLSDLPLCTTAERWQLVAEWNDTAVPLPPADTVGAQIAVQAARTPDAPALTADGRTWSYRELDAAAGRLAAHLRALGVGPEVPVGLCAERSAEMVVGLLAVLRAGGAYLPLDPRFPRERLAFMLADADVPVLLTQRRLVAGLPEHHARVLLLDGAADGPLEPGPGPGVHPGLHPENLAYVIYTSGSTGRPKGVGVRHLGVVNFFAGMDAAVGCGPGDRLLAVTSISFDISVLELFWTLARGAEVVLAGEGALAGTGAAAGEREAARARLAARGMAFSLFYFASESGDSPAPAAGRYRLLLEGARFADRRGFAAVWTPERHFHAFGGLYPNPSVTGAAVAAVTERLAVRAGSVVLPLHDPLRVAEEWAVVDNLSHGRAGIAVASGWHADDFVFQPERYAERKAHLEQGLDVVRRLWRGEAVQRLGGAGREVEVRVLPRPVQPELPVWITAAGAAETFAQAGRLGANVLTHLLGQSIEEVAEKVRVYRQARADHGHDPDSGVVTLMLHTLLGASRDEVRATVRGPFTAYLRSSLGLVANLARSLGLPGDVAAMPERDREDLLAFAFDRYFETSALFGDLAGRLEIVERLAGIGVDEVACLIDFGVDEERVLAGLEHLAALRDAANQPALREAAGARPDDRAAADRSLAALATEDRSVADLAGRHRPTLLQCTPSLLRLLADGPEGWAPLAGLRGLLLGGEALPSSLAAAVQAAVPARLVNVYGPTETTVWSASHPVPALPVEETAGSPPGPPIVPLGRPLANTRIHLLDRRGLPVPAGVPGALHIAGDGLARGYLGRPDLTAARFLPDPLSSEWGGRCYDTGDLARRRADGTLEFLGRADQQIKLRGFRIELGEIEAALAAFPEVAEAAVVVRRGAAGDERLVAFCTLAAGETGSGLGPGLRARLAERLPEPMVPAAVVPLAALPLTPNGKVDRGALARLDLPEAGAAGTGRAPSTPTEEIVAGLYAGLLETGPVAATDSFFGLGGHSLLATQLLSRVRDTFQLDLPLRLLFESPTVAGLAERIEAARRLASAGAQAPPLVPVPRGEGALPLSFVQQRLWFLDRLEPGNPAYNNSAALRLQGPLDAAALERAIGAVIERHEALRTTFPEDPAAPGRPAVVIRPSGGEPAFRLAVEDVELAGPAGEASAALLDLAREDAHLLEIAREDARQPFDLARGPLLRARLLRLGPREAVILLALHHIVSDGWSLGVLVREVGEHYRSFTRGIRPALPDLPVQYADYAVWQRRWLAGEALEAEVAYWREALAGAPTVLELPADRPRPAVRQPHGRTCRFVLPLDLADRLREVSRDQGATLFMTLLAALSALLGVYTGRRDLLVGTPVANRGRSELEGLIGFFVNTLVLRADLAGDPPFAGLVARVRETTLAAHAHQDVPFDQVVEALQVERDLSHTPLFQVAFALQRVGLPRLDLPGVAATPLAVDTGTVKFDWDLSLEETEAGLAGRLAYAAALFDPATVQRAMGHFAILLQGVAEAPATLLSGLPLLTAAERRQLAEWNDPTVPYEPGGLIHQLIATQAARTPEAVAVAFDGRRLTYGALDARAGRVAAALRAASGAGPEGIVGVLMERSLEMVVGLLAVWKAGAAYLPLDPEDPAERLDHMLRDSGAAAVITHERTAERFAGALPSAARELPVLVLGEPSGTASGLRTSGPTVAPRSFAAPAHDPHPGVLPDHPAYVIYTSGSTGVPKGVVVSHRALANRARYAAATDQADAFLQKTTIGFDVSVMEIFGPLLSGGRTVLALPGGQRDSAYLVRLIAEEQVSHASFPPTLLDALLAEGALDDCRALKLVVTGGEAVPPSLPERFYARLQGHPGIVLVNRYGPTETTVSITAWRSGPEPPGRTLPIGRPTASAEVHLLSPDLRPVPIGVPGEICLGGLCLARGYLGRPELTAEKWIPHPSAEEPGARLYRSGDLARFRPDGAVEFLGRVDRQVKIRGFRIELGEIAAVLAAHEEVAEAVAVVREDGGTIGTGRHLVAYYVPRGAAPDEAGLRAFLQRRLPDYMLPARFVSLSALPTNRTGKVDLAALPAPGPRAASGVAEGEAGALPRSTAETALAAIWAQVLGVERVGLDDNFFALGGDSILSLQIVARALQAGLRISPRDVFQHQTVAELAAVAETAAAAASDLLASALFEGAGGPVPLTPIQSWFFAQQPAEPHHWNQAVLLEVRRPLAAGPLAAALAALVVHHEALRLRLTRDAATGEWRQAAVPPGETAPGAPLTALDLSALPPRAMESALTAAAAALQGSLDIAAGPLLRAALFDLGPGRAARLLVAAHHLAVDGVSWRILLDDLESACDQAERGTVPVLPARTTPFTRWAERLAALARSGERAAELDLWLADERARAAQLPLDFVPPGGREGAAAANTAGASGTVRVALDAATTAALLAETSAAAHAGVDAALLAALAEACCAWSGARSLLVNVEGHGREPVVPGADLSRTVGWFTTLAPLLLSLPDGTNPAGLASPAVRAVGQRLAALPDRGLGYGLLRFGGGSPEAAARLAALPQPEIAFNYLGRLDRVLAPASRFAAVDEPAGPPLGPRNRRPHLLQVDAAVRGDSLQVVWTFGERLHRRETVERLAAAHLDALRRLADPGRTAAQAAVPAGADAGAGPMDFDVDLDQEQLDLILRQIGGQPLESEW